MAQEPTGEMESIPEYKLHLTGSRRSDHDWSCTSPTLPSRSRKHQSRTRDIWRQNRQEEKQRATALPSSSLRSATVPASSNLRSADHITGLKPHQLIVALCLTTNLIYMRKDIKFTNQTQRGPLVYMFKTTESLGCISSALKTDNDKARKLLKFNREIDEITSQKTSWTLASLPRTSKHLAV